MTVKEHLIDFVASTSPVGPLPSTTDLAEKLASAIGKSFDYAKKRVISVMKELEQDGKVARRVANRPGRDGRTYAVTIWSLT